MLRLCPFQTKRYTKVQLYLFVPTHFPCYCMSCKEKWTLFSLTCKLPIHFFTTHSQPHSSTQNFNLTTAFPLISCCLALICLHTSLVTMRAQTTGKCLLSLFWKFRQLLNPFRFPFNRNFVCATPSGQTWREPQAYWITS